MTVDPFESEVPDAQEPMPEIEKSLQRDGRGRPLLFPKSGPRVRVPYSRMSSLADYITSQRGVHIWEMRYLARAMALSPDLCTLAAAETYNTGFNMPEPKEKRESGRRLDDIIYRALDRVMIHERADWGSAFHKLTEPGDEGRPVDADMAADVESFHHDFARWADIVDTEVFTANDDLMSAGTFDHLARVPGYEGLCIVDKKTGKFHPEQFAVQFSGYANAEVYDPETDERMTLEEKYGEPINRKWAFVIWTPAKEARTLVFPINIEVGYEVGAKLAAAVRDYQSRNDLAGRVLNPARMARAKAAELLDAAATREEMNEVYARFADVWTPELTERGGQRLAAVERAAA